MVSVIKYLINSLSEKVEEVEEVEEVDKKIESESESESENENENETDSVSETEELLLSCDEKKTSSVNHFLGNFLFETITTDNLNLFFQCAGIFYISNDIYNHFNEVCLFLYYLHVCAIIFGTSFIITASGLNLFFLFLTNYQEEKEIVFTDKYYDSMEKIFANPKIKKEKYENSDPDFLKQLKNLNNHLTEELPYEYNNKLIMYYDDNDEAFHYYTKNSDIQYDVLNTICRCYVTTFNCVNLFKDELDLKRFESESESESENEFEKVDDDNEEEEVSIRETRNSIFYIKKTRKQEEKEKKQQEKKVNKFIYKGNFSDYDLIYKKESKCVKNDINYEDYKNNL